jgi:HYR domain
VDDLGYRPTGLSIGARVGIAALVGLAAAVLHVAPAFAGVQKFELATVDNAAPPDLSWSVSWERFGGGQTTDLTCGGATSQTGTTGLVGNLQTSGSAAGFGSKESVRPTDVSAARGLTFSYWSNSAASTTPVAGAGLCRAGPGSGTLYPHFVDNEPSAIVCPQDIVTTTDPGMATAVVGFAATATDAGPVTLSYSTPPGSAFSVGTTAVTATAVDSSGNAAGCTFTVTVIQS